MTHARLTPLADSLPATVPFVGPETQERSLGRDFKARLGANESVFGPSPNAVAALSTADHWKYGDPESHDLKAALAAHLKANPENIVIGEGIDGLLGYLVRLLVGPMDPVVTSLGAYPTFNYHVAGYGGTLHTVPYREDRQDLPALIAKAKEINAKLIYFSNPDNPMGTYWRGAEIAEHLNELPDGTLLLLDEAYVECAPEDAKTPLAWDDPRLIRMRTFSKVHGLAGARIGYGIGHPDLISAFNKVRNHFGMTRGSQAAALAALADTDWLATIRTRISDARARLYQIAQDNGLAPIPSATNFVTMDCGRDGAFAKSVLDGLIARGIFVRMPFVEPQNRCIRVSCGTDADLDLFAKALPDALKSAENS